MLLWICVVFLLQLFGFHQGIDYLFLLLDFADTKYVEQN